MTGESKRSWLGILKNQEETSDQPPEGSAVDGNLWKAYDQAQGGATLLVELSAQVLASAARQQRLIDNVLEITSNAASRGAEIQEPIERLTMALDRLRLVSLNIGLEGARLGDTAGRALINVADEVRGNTERGSEALQDLRSALEELNPVWDRLDERAKELRESQGTIVSHVGQQQTTAQQVVRDVDELGQHARHLSETDPETARILTQANDHARGLIQALTSLGGRARRELVRSALGPSLQPLLRALIDVAKSTRGDKSSSE